MTLPATRRPQAMLHPFLPSATVILAALAAALPAHGQGADAGPAKAPPVLAMAEAQDLMRVTVGHSRLLTAEAPFETVIVGDDTIANATVGAGNSLILTGLSAGVTNVIVRGEDAGTLLAATLVVVPANGPLRSTVTVRKGTEGQDRYECRGSACELLADEPSGEVPMFLLSSAPQASGEGAAEGGGEGAVAQ